MEQGDVLGGRYRLDDRLGTGGMSVVWRAHDLTLGRDVAVKLHGSQRAQQEPSILAEALIAARVSHPNVAKVYDYGVVATGAGDQVPFLVMELLVGQSLRDRLTLGPIETGTAMRIGAELAAALSAVHAAGLVHRDVKPSNVMLTLNGVKLFDFGIAAPAGVVDDSIPLHQVVGTPAYLAPERVLSDVVDCASDVFAFGVLLYQMLTGMLPWPQLGTDELLATLVCGEPAMLPTAATAPTEVVLLYQRCVAKSRADRPTAVEVRAVLTEAAGTAGIATQGVPVGRLPTEPLPAHRPLTRMPGGAAARQSSAGATVTVRRPRRIMKALVAGRRRTAITTVATAFALAGSAALLLDARHTASPHMQQPPSADHGLESSARPARPARPAKPGRSPVPDMTGEREPSGEGSGAPPHERTQRMLGGPGRGPAEPQVSGPPQRSPAAAGNETPRTPKTTAKPKVRSKTVKKDGRAKPSPSKSAPKSTPKPTPTPSVSDESDLPDRHRRHGDRDDRHGDRDDHEQDRHGDRAGHEQDRHGSKRNPGDRGQRQKDD